MLPAALIGGRHARHGFVKICELSGSGAALAAVQREQDALPPLRGQLIEHVCLQASDHCVPCHQLVLRGARSKQRGVSAANARTAACPRKPRTLALGSKLERHAPAHLRGYSQRHPACASDRRI